IGERRDGVCVGEFTWWRRDGSLMARGAFDDEGSAHGAQERFHPPQMGAPPELASWERYQLGKLLRNQNWTRQPRGSPKNWDITKKSSSPSQSKFHALSLFPSTSARLASHAGRTSQRAAR